MGTRALSPNAGTGRNSSGGASIWGQSLNPHCPRDPARTRGRGDAGIWVQSPNPGPVGNSSGRPRIRGHGDCPQVPQSWPRVPEAKGGQDSGTVPKCPRPQIPASRGRGDGTRGFRNCSQMLASTAQFRPGPGFGNCSQIPECWRPQPGGEQISNFYFIYIYCIYCRGPSSRARPTLHDGQRETRRAIIILLKGGGHPSAGV